MSRTHANRGAGFEGLLTDLHYLYEKQGRCSVFRTPPSMKILSALRGKPGQFICCYAGSGPPDFIAQAEGRSFIFEAKSCGGTSWSFDEMPIHQAERFDAHVKHGAIAFVLVLIEGRVYLMPWATLGPRWWAWHRTIGRAKPGFASVKPKEEPWISPCRDCDWLPQALALPLPASS